MTTIWVAYKLKDGKNILIDKFTDAVEIIRGFSSELECRRYCMKHDLKCISMQYDEEKFFEYDNLFKKYFEDEGFKKKITYYAPSFKYDWWSEKEWWKPQVIRGGRNIINEV